MRGGGRSRAGGFSITELVVVLAIVGLVAAIALSRVRPGQRDAESWADTISRSMAAARLRAVSGRQWYRVTITPSTITTEYTAPSTPPAGNDCAASVGWLPDASLTRTAPREAVTWKATQSPGAPGSPGTVGMSVCFRPDFTQAVRVGSDTTDYLNAYVYVAPPVGVKGWQYRVALEGVGVVNVTNPW
jgi:prepilin-type N-terminal cleavage/methylation domain-containing protein